MKTIKITVGNQEFAPGLTEVTLQVDGSVSVRNRCGERDEDCSLSIAPEIVQSFVGDIARYSKKGYEKKFRDPGEAKYQISLSEKKAVSIWENDLDRYPDIKNTIKILREEIYRESDKKIIL